MILSGATSEEIGEFDYSHISDMSYLFHNSRLLTMPMIDTSNVTNMFGMFSHCGCLRVVPPLDARKVVITREMFSHCSSLIDIPYLDTSGVVDMSHMFFWCSLLEGIPDMDTSSVTGVFGMFGGCRSLKDFNPYSFPGYDSTLENNYLREGYPELYV